VKKGINENIEEGNIKAKVVLVNEFICHPLNEDIQAIVRLTESE
jgi:hypothetical protein